MKLILSVLFAVAPALVYSQYKLIVSGTVPLLSDGTEILLKQFVPYRLRNTNKAYITKVKDHNFKFILNTDGAESYYLGVNRYGYRMFLEPGKADIRITDSTLNKVSVMGNPTNIEYEKYNQSVSDDSLNTEYSNSRDDYYRYRTIKDYDTALAAAKSTKMDSLRLLVQKRDLALCLTWIKQHPKSLINTSILYDQLLYLVPYISEDELKAVYHTLPTDITGNVWGKELRYKIDSLFIGGTAPNFSQPDTSGNQQSLTNFRGKYVLIDFWASWCVPCREENPTLIKVMEKFRDKNFTIIGVSVDDKKVDWIKAIKQDRLHWIQLSSLDGRQNPVAIKYYANSYPYNYLVDPQGKIVAKNLRGDELVAKLNCLFK